MHFLVDACVDVRVAAWLRHQGNDAVHLRDRGLQRSPDRDVFERAEDERRILVTFDLDFGEIAALSPTGTAKVLLLRLDDTRHQHVCDRLDAVLPHCADLLSGQAAVVLVEERRLRIRLLPIGRDQA